MNHHAQRSISATINNTWTARSIPRLRHTPCFRCKVIRSAQMLTFTCVISGSLPPGSWQPEGLHKADGEARTMTLICEIWKEALKNIMCHIPQAIFCIKWLTPADLQSHLKVRRHPSMHKQMLFSCDPFATRWFQVHWTASQMGCFLLCTCDELVSFCISLLTCTASKMHFNKDN